MTIDWGSRETIFRLLAAAFAVIGKEGVSIPLDPRSLLNAPSEDSAVNAVAFLGNLTDNLNSLEARTEKLPSSSESRQRTMLYSVSFEKSRRWPTVSVPDKLA